MYTKEISEGELLGSEIDNQGFTKSIERIIKEHNSLKKNDLVIHMEYGLGKFIGLETIEIDSIKNDLIRIEYGNNTSLLIPVENCDLLKKYSDFNENIKLDSLNSKTWSEKKSRIKKRIRDIAKKLIEFAATRKLKKAQVFIANDGEYEEFCNDFEFEATKDQISATKDIRDDLSSGIIMDRLLCGDVGYGKTEIAMRAAFIVTNNREKAQVAVITPTTLLCKQHYDKFIERFKNTDINIRSLSRYNSKIETKEIKNDLNNGKIDIIIGTHSLLNDGIKFRNLGLIIVDEEQRFGVGQKEKLKELRLNVHILSMSATPIPRTLQMSMSGIKDLSLITTPPLNRNNIETIVCEYDDDKIKEIIENEIKRDGLIFFVVPRITDIREAEARLKLSMPNLKYCIVHGQMKNEKTNEIMEKFYNGDFRVLIATTIIENGIDIPRANTIIIYRANNFGLAQLYQLRGRVGRDKMQGYAYLTVKKTEKLSEEAHKRLNIIGAIKELGAGFIISSNDMEIRGAGNILGEAQTGHIKEIGIELYNQLLKEAVESIKDEDDTINEQEFSPEIKLGISTIIPSNYIDNVNIKIKYYRLIADITNSKEAEEIQSEIENEYGSITESLKNLLDISLIKIECKKLNIQKITYNSGKIIICFYKNKFANPDNLIKYVLSHPSIVKFKGEQLVFFTNKNLEIIENVNNILKLLKNIL